MLEEPGSAVQKSSEIITIDRYISLSTEPWDKLSLLTLHPGVIVRIGFLQVQIEFLQKII